MNVTLPVGMPSGIPLSVQINGASGGTVEIIIEGESCAIRKVLPVDASGSATLILPLLPCMGTAVQVKTLDGAGHLAIATTFRI